MKIEIDKKSYEAQPNETILSVANKNGIEIPSLCFLKDVRPSASCRICVVENLKTGRLIPACSSMAEEGIAISTCSKKVMDARKTNLELVISNHNYDCENCTKNGNCKLQDLVIKYNINPNRFIGEKTKAIIDKSSPAIIRDNTKCILCRKCVQVCKQKQTVHALNVNDRGFNTNVGTAFMENVIDTNCVACGQCVKVCPTGALTENFNIKEVEKLLKENKKHLVAIPAPTVRVTLGEEFGLKEGTNLEPVLPSLLKKIGFNKVFDVNFAADLTIMEESKEFIERLKKNKDLPLLTSCCPAWVDFVKKFYPELEKNISTTLSPQEMMGSVIKSYYAQLAHINPSDIVVVSIMPCTAKKKELVKNNKFVDYSLTIREVAHIIKMQKVDICKIEPMPFDDLLGASSGAGVIFGASGGVMEAALRTAVDMISGKELETIEYKSVRGLKNIKIAEVQVLNKTIKVGVVSGLNSARKVLDKIKSKQLSLDFLEVMSCEGGCINGGGTPYEKHSGTLENRKNALYEIDKNKQVRKSYKNKDVIEFYKWQSSAQQKAQLHTH